jgi:hypothetical protein
MAQVIEFCAPSHFRPKVTLLPQEQRAKVIAFMSHREEEAEIVCASVYERLNSKSSDWLDSWADEYPIFKPRQGSSSFRLPDRSMIPADSK